MIKKYSFRDFLSVLFVVSASITLLSLFFTSCRSAKYIEDDQLLVKSTDIIGLPPDMKERASYYISNEIKPNSKLNLTIYNLVNTKDGSYKKQGIRNVGEPPHIVDSSLVDLSATQIAGYLQTKGYFNALVKPELEAKKRKAAIKFNVSLGQPYLFNKISYDAKDSLIKEIYATEVMPLSGARADRQFDSEVLLRDREALYLKLKSKGYYEYLRQYMRVAVDTNTHAQRANLHFEIQNPSDSTKHQVYHVDSVSVTILRPDNHSSKREPKRYRDTSLQLSYHDQTGRFRLKPIARYMYVREGKLYNLSEETRSYDRLYEMNGFRNVKINYEKLDSNSLAAHYQLTPRPLMANQVEGEFAFSSGMSGFNVGNTFSHRNVFGGAELLELKLRYGVLFDPRLAGGLSSKIFNNDFQVGVNLSFPRLLTPFENASTGTYGLPRTTFATNLQLFQQDNTYSNRYLTTSLNYLWYSSERAQHSLTPISLDYRLGRFDEAFKQQLIDQGYMLYVESNDREYIGLSSAYSYTFDARKLLRLENFNYFKTSIESSGNLLGALSRLTNAKTNASGERLLMGVPYLQYVKTELDFRHYKHLGGYQQLVFRFNGGIAVPYGNNSKLLIFEKSFYAGGMNGIRAWQARTLGPGRYNRADIPESLRLNLRNLDQLGEIKLEANAEYRFRMLNSFLGAKLNGATFLDAGNVWLLRDNGLTSEGKFKAAEFLSQVALGTGFGLRMDMDYFIIRFDVGLKLKDPQFSGSDQWVIKDFFNSKEFKKTYNETHSPDRYNFLQYNFSVGLPF